MSKKKQEPTFSEKLDGLFEKYADTTNAILVDYASYNGLIDELGYADANLKEQIEELCDKESTYDYDKALQQFKTQLDSGNKDKSEIFTDLEIDNSDLISVLRARGYVIIKTDNLAQQAKLETFIAEELYPNYNDHEKYEL